MYNNYAGIDFGTSNSTVAISHNGSPQLINLEDDHKTIPSVIFFDMNRGKLFYGREGIHRYNQREGGRMMRSLKSLLGTSTMEDSFRLKLATGENKIFSYVEILVLFAEQLKNKAEVAAGREVSHVVVGRPVHFIDFDTEADKKAEDQLRKIMVKAGFSHVEFQYEPVAAALSYEATVKKEELALIVDIGGGTSDFTVIRLSPDRHLQSNRSEDILANAGIHIGGNDFDRLFNLHRIMPLFGYMTKVTHKNLYLPAEYFVRMATVQQIQTLYNKKTLYELGSLKREAVHPELLQRLIQVIEFQEGHLISQGVEAAKMELTSSSQSLIDLWFAEKDLSVNVTRQDLEETIAEKVDDIVQTATDSVKTAGVNMDEISTVFLTGGSTSIPYVRSKFTNLFPNAHFAEGDQLGAVGHGLGIEALRRFA